MHPQFSTIKSLIFTALKFGYLKRFIFLIAAFFSLGANAQKARDAFSIKETERIVSYLASDELKGRKIYSPEIDKAADFIAEHFQKAGLQTFNHAPTYLQTFYMLSPRPTGISATINDTAINPEHIIAITAEKELKVSHKCGYAISKINADDNLFREAYGLVQKGTNQIVLVDTVHADNFMRLAVLKRNLMKPSASVIFILGQPEMKKFCIRATHVFTENKLSNVVATLPGRSKPDEFVIFSAHYDHIGIGAPQNGDSIYNGANDNASGTTALLLLADYFSTLKNNERTIIFVAFTAEESGGFGSKFFSKQIAPEKIVAMLNIEMVGTQSKWGENTAYVTGFERSGLGEILQKNLKSSRFNMHPDPYPDQQLFFRSDNTAFAILGVPAHSISTAKMDDEPHYHKASDETKTLDIANLAEIAKAIGLSAESIISGKNTPSRVNTEALRR